MTRAAIRRWQWLHRWSSLVSTTFLLMLCVTGLPLIFEQEIEAAMQAPLPAPVVDPPDVDALIGRAIAARPGSAVRQLYFPPDRRLVEIEVSTPRQSEDESGHFRFDMRSGDAVPEAVGSPVLDVIRELHVEMFASLPGSLLLGAMALLMLVAIVSGVALYGPFTRKLPFGTVRPARRARWLDLHNLLGIATVGWLSVVGLTGAVNTLADPVARQWQQTGLAAMAAPFLHGPTPDRLVPVAGVIRDAERAAPGMWVTGVYYPGSPFATPRHYGVYLRGATPVTSRLLTPMLVDAATGRIDAVGRMPLHVNALLLSQPLHFGDYGGLPLKLIWATFDVAAIIVLVTGLWLFAKRGRVARDGADEAQVFPKARSAVVLSRTRQWRLPILLGIASLIGLLLALLSTPGPGRWLAWALLATPLASSIVAVARSRRSQRRAAQSHSELDAR